MRISIVGAGAWGTALALIAARRHDVTLYARDAALAEQVRASRDNVRYLPGFPLPPAVVVTSLLGEAVRDAELVVLAPLREGGSLPGLVEADDDGLYVLKFRGAGQGPRALAAEVIVGELARGLGLPVPELVTRRRRPAARRAPSPTPRSRS